MSVNLRIQAASIVLVGTFSPAMFHPAWLAANDLIRQQEADQAKIDVIHSKVAQFSVVEWLQLMVTENRLQVRTTLESYYDPLRDLVLGILGLLGATPIRQLGLNGEFEFELPTVSAWHAVGDRLAPKQPWQSLLQEPGMLNVIMQGQRTDGQRGHVQVHVGPCDTFPNGVRVHVNDHYELGDDLRKGEGSAAAARILTEAWRQSVDHSLTIAKSIVQEHD